MPETHVTVLVGYLGIRIVAAVTGEPLRAPTLDPETTKTGPRSGSGLSSIS